MTLTNEQKIIIRTFAKTLGDFVNSAEKKNFTLGQLLEGTLLIIAKGQNRVAHLLSIENPELSKQVNDEMERIRQCIRDGFKSIIDHTDNFILEITYKRIVYDVKYLSQWLIDIVGEEEGQEQNKKNDRKKTKEKRLKPWINSKDARFIIKDNRIIFHYKDKDKDLRLKNESRTHTLLFLFAGKNPLPSMKIKNKICTPKTRPSDVVKYANEKLNEKIAAMDFQGIPKNIEFIKYDKQSDCYGLSIRIKHKDDIDCSDT